MTTSMEKKDFVQAVDELEGKYKEPTELVVLKQIDKLDDHCRRFVALSPFLVLATYDAAGVDCSPKGGPPGFVRVPDDKTLLIPDRPGNNRIDSIRNIVQSPKAGVIFFIPGCHEAFRVSGEAAVSLDSELLAQFDGDARPPKSVIVIHVEKAYLHCGQAIHLADLWNPDTFLAQEQLPDFSVALKAHVEYSRTQQE